MEIKVPTVHNEAKKGDIAKTVILLGDPLRAKFVADNFLEDVTCYNDVRNMLGFTGEYKGVEISVQGSGMGIPSMGIYSMELFLGYDVDNIIRVGTCGRLSNPNASYIANSVNLRDIVVAEYANTDSNYLTECTVDKKIEPVCSNDLLDKLRKIAKLQNVDIKIGTIFTSDVFYKDISKLMELSKTEVIGVEMETLALYANANITNKKALAMFTVSDNPILGEAISSEEREKGLGKMIKLALELAYECEK